MTSSSVTIWDVPTRLLHWSFVACFGVSWWSAEYRLMDVHRYSGYVLLGLLVFRVYWGIFGSSSARFAQFIRGPKAVIDYVRRTSGAVSSPGHNPIGGWSVVAMLTLMLAQVVLGLFVTDIDGLESGPLSYLVSFETSRVLAEAHEIVFNTLLVFTALHVIAVLFYLFAKRTNLITPMVTGRAASASTDQRVAFASLWRALPGIVIAAIAVWFVTKNG